jgi:hypothetical protein
MVHYRLGNYQNSVDDATAVTKMNSQRRQALRVRSAAHGRLGQESAAIADLEKYCKKETDGAYNEFCFFRHLVFMSSSRVRIAFFSRNSCNRIFHAYLQTTALRCVSLVCTHTRAATILTFLSAHCFFFPFFLI